MGRFGHKMGQDYSKPARFDVLHENGPLLGAGNTFFRNKKNITLPQKGGSIGFGNITNVIFISYHMCAQWKTLITNAVNLNIQIFAFIAGQFSHKGKAPFYLPYGMVP